MNEPVWLTLARELQAIGQAGLAFSKDPYDLQRFKRIQELSATAMALGTDEDVEKIRGLFRQDVGYPTPKVDVRGAAFREDRILMVREASDGGWTLPGGWADVNQSAAECVEREIAEESGFSARAIKLAAVFDYRKQGHRSRHPASIYKIFFLCEITGGEPRASEETTEVGFFAESNLPELSHGRITTAQIRRMFEHRRQFALPTDFE
jgi:ADP-ribose pyrophosphatase YjhB (NUDIX family)